VAALASVEAGATGAAGPDAELDAALAPPSLWNANKPKPITVPRKRMPPNTSAITRPALEGGLNCGSPAKVLDNGVGVTPALDATKGPLTPSNWALDPAPARGDEPRGPARLPTGAGVSATTRSWVRSMTPLT
jgi:hypothetical protein